MLHNSIYCQSTKFKNTTEICLFLIKLAYLIVYTENEILLIINNIILQCKLWEKIKVHVSQ